MLWVHRAKRKTVKIYLLNKYIKQCIDTRQIVSDDQPK